MAYRFASNLFPRWETKVSASRKTVVWTIYPSICIHQPQLCSPVQDDPVIKSSHRLDGRDEANPSQGSIDPSVGWRTEIPVDDGLQRAEASVEALLKATTASLMNT